MMAQVRMKQIGERCGVAAGMYILIYAGANDVLWPLICHFHHPDWQVPALLDGAISSVLLPCLIAYLLTATLRKQPSPWPFLIAPVLLMAGIKYAEDAFYPPYLHEVVSLLAAGAIQGATAWAGWFLYMRWNRRSPSGTKTDGEPHAQFV